MGKIKINNFGPVKSGFQGNSGWLDINKVTVFVGNQGSGKSTVAKLISTFLWIEKALVRGDYEKDWFEKKNKLRNQFLPYHRISSYIYPNTVIEYEGEAYSIRYRNDSLAITENDSKSYPLPQIMYVPAERNFITYLKGARELKLSSASLQDFNTEYFNAKQEMKGAMRLPINDADIEYNKQYNNLYLKVDGEKKIEISDASSGFQSFVPLYLVSEYLANSVKKHSENKELMSSEEEIRFKKGVQEIWKNDSLTDEQKRIALSALSARFNKAAFINIVEEPEQNLFPSSQWKMLQSLLEFNNINDNNKLIITTHSPYLISYLTLAVKAGELGQRLKTGEQNATLGQIVPLAAIVDATALSIYELDEKTGAINPLETFNGLPSDENRLNAMLDEGNELFAQLLEIQQQL
ncbi:MAG: ATP-binding protein [Prevotellaceae bacterium]|jgi:predicted ATPase|nr:ATP-binding protein [Prevotellaceae bacterium]